MQVRLVEVEKELTLLDSLKFESEVKESKDLINLIELSRTKLDDKVNIEKELAEINVVKLLKPFLALEVSKETMLKKIAINCILLFLFGSLILSCLVYWYKNSTNEF